MKKIFALLPSLEASKKIRIIWSSFSNRKVDFLSGIELKALYCARRKGSQCKPARKSSLTQDWEFTQPKSEQSDLYYKKATEKWIWGNFAVSERDVRHGISYIYTAYTVYDKASCFVMPILILFSHLFSI